MLLYGGSGLDPESARRFQAIFGQPDPPATRAPHITPVEALVADGRYDAAVQHVLMSYGSVHWVPSPAVTGMFAHLKATVDEFRTVYRTAVEQLKSRGLRAYEREVSVINRDSSRRMLTKSCQDAIALARRLIESGNRGAEQMTSLYRSGGDFARYIAETSEDPSQYADLAMWYYREAIATLPESLTALEVKNSIGLAKRASEGNRSAIKYLEGIISQEQESLVVRMANELTSPDEARRRLEVLDLMRHNVAVWKESADLDEWVVV